MKQKLLGAAILCIGILSTMTTASAYTSGTLGQDGSSPFMREFGRSLPPIGHVSFCRNNPGDCKRVGPKRATVELSLKRKADLRAVNDLVNRMVRPVSDMTLYGRIEHWAYPDGMGDCEDYVLLKQRLLMERGWPKSALLITVVRDENNEGHAILTARTSLGDYLLDNKRAEIMTWNESAYTFIKRQSDRNPKDWVSLTRPGRLPQQKTTADTGRN